MDRTKSSENQGLLVCVSYRTLRLYIRSFQSNGDAVEEDENQNHVVEQFVRDHTLAPHTASERRHAQSHL